MISLVRPVIILCAILATSANISVKPAYEKNVLSFLEGVTEQRIDKAGSDNYLLYCKFLEGSGGKIISDTENRKHQEFKLLKFIRRRVIAEKNNPDLCRTITEEPWLKQEIFSSHLLIFPFNYFW